MALLVFQKHFPIFILLFAPSVGSMRVYLHPVPHGDSTHFFSPISNRLQWEAVACKDVDAIPPQSPIPSPQAPCLCSKQLCSIRPKTKAALHSAEPGSMPGGQVLVISHQVPPIFLWFNRGKDCNWMEYYLTSPLAFFFFFFKRPPLIPTKTSGSSFGNTFTINCTMFHFAAVTQCCII